MKANKMPWLILCATPVLLALCLLAGASGFGFIQLSTDLGQAIFFLRLNRVIAAFVVGAALSAAGVVLQALLRNPLAEPYILGVSSGSALGAAIAIISGTASLTMAGMPITAFIFGAATLITVYYLANTAGRLSIYGLILSGVIVSSICSSILMFIISYMPIEGLHTIIWWMLGNLQASSLPLLYISAIIILVGILGIWIMNPELNALSIGHDTAHHVGIRTGPAIATGLALATLITATAVSLAGLIGFVGLIVPHVVRNLTGPDHKRLVPSAALAGGVFLALCDAVARTALAPREIPVGVITALIGGPFFLAILRSRRKEGWLE